MKKFINRKIRKILFWLFKDRIKAFAISTVIDEFDMIQSKGDIVDYVKKEMAIKMGVQLLEEGAIDIEREVLIGDFGRRYTMRLYVLPPKI